MKYVRHLVLHNFQSHADSELELGPGLNVISGPSDNGKSAILRAIRWALYNEPRGNSFVRAGTRECRVEVTMSDGGSIVRELAVSKSGTTTRNRYVVAQPGAEPQVFEGFGTVVPDEVAWVHGMTEVVLDTDKQVVLNFGSQLEGPFLLAETPSVRARALGRLLGVHVVDSAIRTVQKDLLGLRRETAAKTAALERLETALAAFADIPHQEQQLQDADRLLRQAAGDHARWQRLDGLRRKKQELDSQVARQADRIAQSTAAIQNAADEYRRVLIELGQCPTCMQPLTQAEIERTVAALRSGIQADHLHGQE